MIIVYITKPIFPRKAKTNSEPLTVKKYPTDSINKDNPKQSIISKSPINRIVKRLRPDISESTLTIVPIDITITGGIKITLFK